MRLEPITRPTGLTMRIAFWMSKRQLGKVMTPLSVVYARVPPAMKMGYGISKFTKSGLTLDRELTLILQTHTAQINDCKFCVDIAKATALRGRLGIDRIGALDNFESSSLFTEREKAALAYVEETTRNKKVIDSTFNRLKKHFTDVEIAEITLLNAIENFYNLINLPLEIESDGLCALVPPEFSPEIRHASAG
ncbi:MAG: hypothetical protein COA73_11245 [Candidatus Hydrogenedentota bacterium]|nr:MAG: hypothetical protein COA73_11245 [Candidatus Hydrogenedentota bacterium]